MLSTNGKCYVFDRRAAGLIPGEAVAAVLLKPLSKAIADRDHIYGCIKASGVNYDGKTNGIAAPNPVSQTDLLKNIYDKYRINPNKIQYVLAHSVGSKIGDSIEFEALTKAFKGYTSNKQYCNIGSFKPLIGHTFAASGVVSIIGMLMAMKYRLIPATFNYEFCNEYIDFTESPFIINTENQPWPTKDNQTRLGVVSTTGISGTNAHAVIEEYLPEINPVTISMGQNPITPCLFVLSAKSEAQLKIYAQKMKDFLACRQHLTYSLWPIPYKWAGRQWNTGWRL